MIAPDLLGHGESAKPRGDYSLGAFAVWLRDLLDELGVMRATVVGQSLGGGVAMQFGYQHRDRCERLILIGSGGLGPDLNWMLRLLSAPAPSSCCPPWRRHRCSASATPSGPSSRRPASTPRGSELWSAYSSLSDRETRSAFLRTLRSVVDHRGQAVSALNRLHLTAQVPTLLIWGDDDRIIPSRTAGPRTRRCRAADSKCCRGGTFPTCGGTLGGDADPA